MNETTGTEQQVAAAPPEPQSPYDFLALFPGAPTPDQIETYRKMVPGGRLRLLPMKDGKRLFLLRGFTALELQAIQADAAKAPAEKQGQIAQTSIVLRCTLWTSTETSGKLTEAGLAASGAGLVSTLNIAITDLSDYNDPAVLEQLYVDL